MLSPFFRFGPIANLSQRKYNKGEITVEANYPNMSFFNHDAYVKLAEKIKSSDSQDAVFHMNVLNDAITSFREYVNRVDAGEQQIRLAAVRFEGEEYREMVTRYDQNRHDQHEAAITNVKVVNRLASIYGTDPLFTGDDSSRLEIADFCLSVVVEIFQNRMM